MLSPQQLEELPNWKKVKKRYALAGEENLQSGEDKLARRVAKMLGMSNTGKNLDKWIRDQNIHVREDATLWEKVMRFAQVEGNLNTAYWRPLVVQAIEDIPEKFETGNALTVFICWAKNAERTVVAYVLDKDVYVDELPIPCRVVRGLDREIIIICELKEIIKNEQE